MTKSRDSLVTRSPTKIRMSLGTAIVLGLLRSKIEAKPTTAYLMTYRDGKCLANCAFCPQARTSSGKTNMLSRITWPSAPLATVIKAISETYELGQIERVCIQALNYPEVFTEISWIVTALKANISIPVSVSCQPLRRENIILLFERGVERIGIPLDAATEKIFEETKGTLVDGPYSWSNQLDLLQEAVKIFGKGKVSTHLIVGLGETEKQMITIIQECWDAGISPALFALTPIVGTRLEQNQQPPIDAYRRIQIGRYLIVNKLSNANDFGFDKKGRVNDFGVTETALKDLIIDGRPFLTSGCPNCNRPFYNEKPSGPIYNYARPPDPEQLLEIRKSLFA